ncbi:MAG: ferrous iron transport protein A [Clostridia bacterium]|nr:ferrous iron transport protein A [Clostridia bacterium]
MRLSDIAVGERARVAAVTPECSLRRRFFDIGLVRGTEVLCVSASPSGDPRAYLIRGAVIAIRARDCKDVLVF